MLRRDFLQSALFAAAACATEGRLLAAVEPAAAVPIKDRICLFTDHLDDFGYSHADLVKMFAPLKIAGPDLTLRGGGVVLPDRVAEELPKVAAAFREAGMSIPMLSTTLTSAKDVAAKPILSTMGLLGIKYFKLGYYHYHDLAKWESDIESQREELASLLTLARQHQAHAGLHNHAGAGIGGAVWDAWEMLKPLNPADVGFFFDPSHASIEGPKHTWKLNFQRISPRLSMVAVKDYTWEKTAKGWQTRWCPLGEGMVNWTEFFQMLAKFPFAGPLSVHIEYNPGGSTRVEQIDNALAAAQRDIDFVRKFLRAS